MVVRVVVDTCSVRVALCLLVRRGVLVHSAVGGGVEEVAGSPVVADSLDLQF